MHRVSRLLVALALVAAPAAAQTRHAPTVDDVLDLVQVSSVEISPDGSRVLYTRSEVAWKDNKRVSAIWIAHADGTNAYRLLASDKDRNAAWSPDGQSIAFLSTRNGNDTDKTDEAGAQIWIIRTTGGEAYKLTELKTSVSRFRWAADSSRLFFLADDIVAEDEKKKAKDGDDAIYVDEGPNGQAKDAFSQIWVVTLADKAVRQLTREQQVIEDLAPSPDGTAVAFIGRPNNIRNRQNLAEVQTLDVASGRVTALTKNQAPERDVEWTPDGKAVSYQAPSDAGWDLAQEKLYVVPAAGGPARRIADAFTGDIGAYFWAPDGRSVLFSGSSKGRGGADVLDVATGKVRAVAAGDTVLTVSSASSTRGTAAGTISTPTTPGEAVVVDVASGRVAKITGLNPQVATWALSQFRTVTWKSPDGLEIEGMLWLPADYTPGTKLPLLLSIHGGPAGVWRPAFSGIDHVYTSLGWAVLEPNVRGSTSYGDALLRGNLKDIGGGDYQDAQAGVDLLVTQGIADPDKLAVRGWSYGGILGGWTLTQTTRFKAASLGAMVADWASEYAMGFNHDVRLWYIVGTPWDNAEGYRRRSSYAFVSKVTTPTLLLHGEKDDTDTIGQSMMFYQGLKDRGVPTRFIRFPREPHGFREPRHQRLRDMAEIQWLMKYARGVDWTIPERKADDKKDTTKP